MTSIPFPLVFVTAISSFIAFLLLYDSNERKWLLNTLNPEAIYSKIVLILMRYLTHHTSDDRRETSAWCQGNDSFSRRCHFRNLCYLPNTKEFVFMVNENSVFNGFSMKEHEKLLYLSPIVDHNAFYFTFSSILEETVPEGDIQRVEAPVFIMKRFKLDNLMHIFHDDLLPLYFTYEEICLLDVLHCAKKLQLVLIDDYPAGPYFELFNMFSSRKPIIQLTLPKSRMYCFNQAYVGHSKISLWYQYGFLQPQGAIPSKLNVHDLNRFSQFIETNLPIRGCKHPANLLFLTRRRNRRIVNENDVVTALKNSYESVFKTIGKIDVIDEEKVTFSEMFCKVRSANVVVAMHGASLVITLFLQPGSGVLELFPYAINSSLVTPFLALSNLNGRGIFHTSWTNEDPQKTLPHPDAAPVFGGISHLEEHIQSNIRRTTIVPEVLCCHDPLYLYRMYQDTIVDTTSLLPKLNSLMQEVLYHSPTQYSQKILETLQSHVIIGYVQSIHCYQKPKDPYFYVQWDPPWGVKRINLSVVQYEVWVADIDDDSDSTTTLTEKTLLKIFKKKPCADIYAWISVRSKHPTLTSWTKCLCKR